MINAFFAFLWEVIKANVSTSILLIGITLILTIWIAIKIDRGRNRDNAETEMFKKKFEISEKQRIKLETLVAELPCVDKENATWLQNINKNGGECPSKNICKYREDIEKEKNKG